MKTIEPKTNIEDNPNIAVPAIIFLSLLAAFYYFISVKVFASANTDTDTSNTVEQEETAQYLNYTLKIQDNQILNIKLRSNDDYYIDGNSIYQGQRRGCFFSYDHISYYKNIYNAMKRDGFVEENIKGNLQYILSSSGNLHSYLIKINDFYYTLDLYSYVSLDQVKECFSRLTITVK